jgi:hypothetical protein
MYSIKNNNNLALTRPCTATDGRDGHARGYPSNSNVVALCIGGDEPGSLVGLRRPLKNHGQDGLERYWKPTVMSRQGRVCRQRTKGTRQSNGRTDGRMDATSRSATCSVQGRPARGSNFEPGEQRQCQRFSASLTDGGAAHHQCDGGLLRCARQSAVLSRFETAAGLVDRSNADSSAVTPSLTDYVVRRAPSLRRYYQRASSS